MKKNSSKNGSALLIVIGMLAFLIVSAVGFSAYMRYARLPSSYLRRSSSSRQLVKAALAQAIDYLDVAIGNNPHPSIGHDTTDDRRRNVWCHRVLVGTNVAGNVTNLDVKNLESLGFYYDTVSTLSFEALAYIPPPLINEARYVSRLSPTALWKSFDFDVGRYAFTVLDVSDYFDINRLFANRRRSSVSNQRISLSYIFEDDGHSGVGSGADQWDEFMKQFRDVDDKTGEISFGSKFPLISMADFNLALYNKGEIGGMYSPFCRYAIDGGRLSDSQDPMSHRMTFVTDGLFPETNNTARLDICDSRNQPYDPARLDTKGGKKVDLAEILGGNWLSNIEWSHKLGGAGSVALFDYLDTDSVPVSLAMPTVERVPMVCGIKVMSPESKFTIVREEGAIQAPDTDESTREVTQSVSYKIKGADFVSGFQGGKVEVLAAYPFLHEESEKARSFNVDGRFSFFMTKSKPHLRVWNASEKLRYSLPKDFSEAELNPDSGMINIPLSTQALKLPNNTVTSEDDAVLKLQEGLSLSKGNDLLKKFEEADLLKVTYTWTQKKVMSEGFPSWSPAFETVRKNPVDNKASIVTESAFKILDPDNSYQPYDVAKLGQEMQTAGNTAGLKGVVLNSAVWVRVKDEEDNVVDMVPACLFDDATQNNRSGAKEFAEGPPGELLGSAYPLIPIETGVSFDFTVDGLDGLAGEGDNGGTSLEIKLLDKALLVTDPRYNYAPEAWISKEGVSGVLEKNVWLDEVKTLRNSQSDLPGRSRDVFMAVSDAGYLQSLQELAFLPRLTDLKSYGNDQTRGNLPKPDGSSKTDLGKSFTDSDFKNFAWCTYDLIDDDYEAFASLPWFTGGRGFKVNPYSDSTNVLMSVFANTPLNWRCSSTNAVDGDVDFSKMEMKDFNTKYAFNEYNSSARVDWDFLESLAGEFMKQVRANSDERWEDVWRTDMNWRSDGGAGNSSDSDYLCGKPLPSGNTKLWDVDKKFMYGFWSDCFAVKQQLFLVFVRAEPTMMGAGMSGQIPPQLGGRAMALVWRDPNAAFSANTDSTQSGSGKNNYYRPHKTRVLFYRQFD